MKILPKRHFAGFLTFLFVKIPQKEVSAPKKFPKIPKNFYEILRKFKRFLLYLFFSGKIFPEMTQIMKILAIETVDVSASAAILEDETVLEAVHLDPKQRSAQFLAPAVRQLLTSQGWKPTDIELIAVVQGPGSFTGLRVGIAFAKVFAYAVGADVIAFNTLDLLAVQVPENVEHLSAALDAQREQVVTKNYVRNSESGVLEPESPMKILDQEDWLENLPENIWITGPILAKIAKKLPENVHLVPSECWTPSVETMGKAAFRLYQEGRRDDIWNLLPIYSRPAAAEERRIQKEK